MTRTVIAIGLLMASVVCSAATTWHVDAANTTGTESGSQDYPFNTIQEGIDAATDGDTVLVHDGLYTGDGNYEIDYGGKAITVTSANGPADCVIDCEGRGRAFLFHTGETAASVVNGFTIRQGVGTPIPSSPARGGGGIACWRSAPTITNNVITECDGLGGPGSGGGILCYESPATITDNTIRDCIASQGGGISVWFTSGGLISRNLIADNFAASGGGIRCHRSSSPTISENVIVGNTAGYGGGAGGGIECSVQSSPLIANNLIAGNRCFDGSGGGIFCSLFAEPVLIGNTFAQNSTPDDGGTPGDWFDDAWTGGDYHLQDGSPCINAGDNSAVQAGDTDIDGEARIQHLVADMGADETDSIGAPNPPGQAELDEDVLVGGLLNPEGPGATSVTLDAVNTAGNPPETLYAIQHGTDPNAGWLHFVDDGGRTDAMADGTAADWHTAAEWEGKRIRGLTPDTTYTFAATCRMPPGGEALGMLGAHHAVLADIATFTTSRHCDVNRNGLPTGLDYGARGGPRSCGGRRQGRASRGPVTWTAMGTWTGMISGRSWMRP